MQIVRRLHSRVARDARGATKRKAAARFFQLVALVVRVAMLSPSRRRRRHHRHRRHRRRRRRRRYDCCTDRRCRQ